MVGPGELQVMLDLETLGTGTRAAIVQIGACEWTFEDGPRGGRTFRESVTLDSCLRAGLTVDAGAVLFWLRQKREVVDSVFFPGDGHNTTFTPMHLPYVLSSFSQWLPTGAPVWGNGALFDNRLLIEACDAVGFTHMIGHRDHRDVRTLVALARAAGIEGPEALARPDNAHDALVDAIYQAEYCSWIARRLLKLER